MKAKQKFLISYLILLIIIMPACFTVLHETASSPKQLLFKESIALMKESIKDTKQNPFFANEKVVKDVIISDDGFKLINIDNSERYFAFKKVRDPRVCEDHFTKIVFVDMGQLPGNNLVFTNSKSAKMFADGLFYLKNNAVNIEQEVKRETEQERDDCLRRIRQTPIDLILAGTTAHELNLPCSGVAWDSLESILNEMLIEWKNKGFAQRLQKTTPSHFSDLIVMLEKGILKLDHKAKELKDAADEDARQVAAPGQAAPAKKTPGALSVSHLLEQRKTILMVLLGTVKQAAGQRAAGG